MQKCLDIPTSLRRACSISIRLHLWQDPQNPSSLGPFVQCQSMQLESSNISSMWQHNASLAFVHDEKVKRETVYRPNTVQHASDRQAFSFRLPERKVQLISAVQYYNRSFLKIPDIIFFQIPHVFFYIQKKMQEVLAVMSEVPLQSQNSVPHDFCCIAACKNSLCEHYLTFMVINKQIPFLSPGFSFLFFLRYLSRF